MLLMSVIGQYTEQTTYRFDASCQDATVEPECILRNKGVSGVPQPVPFRCRRDGYTGDVGRLLRLFPQQGIKHWFVFLVSSPRWSTFRGRVHRLLTIQYDFLVADATK